MSSTTYTPRPLKRVRFDNVVSVLCRVPTVEHKQDVWYSKAEFAAFTKELRATIRKLRKHSSLMTRLEEAFQFSLSLAGNLVDEYDEETALLRIRSHENLSCWVGGETQSFRGLETLSSPLIKYHSNLCRRVNAQLGDFIKTGQTDEEDVQKLLSNNSRCARIFARLMAECDATAAAATTPAPVAQKRPLTPELESEEEEEEEEEESCAPVAKKLKPTIMPGGRRLVMTSAHSNKYRPYDSPKPRLLPITRKQCSTW